MKLKVLFIVSLIINCVLVFIIFIKSNDYYMRYLREAKYLFNFSKEIIINAKVKVNTKSKYIKGYKYYQSDEMRKYNLYLFDINEKIDVTESKADSGFYIETDNNNFIKDFGWFKP